MKKPISRIVISSIICLALFSCKDNVEKNNIEDKQESESAISNQNEDTYQPGADWKLVWSDEFNEESIDENNWNLQVEEAGRFNEEWQRYTSSSDNAFVDNDVLVIRAVHESDVHGMDQYTSARLNTANKYSFKYGKISARIKLPQGQGIWPAFWLLGANIDENGGDTPWPQCGEIDILELYGSHSDSVVEANVHYADSTDSHKMMGAVPFELEQGKFADEFHVFELEWNETSISWLVDGKEYASMPITAKELSEFHEEFFIVLNIAVGGTYAGRPDDTTVFPQNMYVDWVRVYKKRD